MFSEVGSSNDFSELAIETVKADLRLRELLAGEPRAVWAEVERDYGKSLRSGVRNALIADAILDQAYWGNVFGLERLLAVRDALPGLRALRQEAGQTDALYEAAVLQYANSLLHPGVPTRFSSPKLDFAVDDINHFDEDALSLYSMMSALEAVATPLARAREHLDEWKALVSGTKSDWQPINPRKFEKYKYEHAVEPFTPSTFTAVTVDLGRKLCEER